ncbi:MAG: GNAT family N-acetyltransferase [Clostridiales bacterium]|nr:GNAT family N-acetyltransferase [Clostridiales bacterium]
MKHLGTKPMRTARLTLRPFEVADAEAMYNNWASDPEVVKYLTWPVHASAELTRSLLKSWCEKYAQPDYYQWAIVPDGVNEPIGSIAAVTVNDRTGCITIGYCMAKRWWGQGLMPEALSALIRFFFDEVGANRIDAQHDANNPKSGRVMQKAGMRKEGVLRAAGVNNQGVCDEVIYAILREEYLAEATNIWKRLYLEALAVQNDRTVSPFIEAGGVAAAILTHAGSIYTGVCIDTASTLGMCAERNAIANMLTHGESRISKVVAVMPDGRVGPPCGACREYMMQLDKNSGSIEILLALDPVKTITLRELTPYWWGEERFADE